MCIASDQWLEHSSGSRFDERGIRDQSLDVVRIAQICWEILFSDSQDHHDNGCETSPTANRAFLCCTPKANRSMANSSRTTVGTGTPCRKVKVPRSFPPLWKPEMRNVIILIPAVAPIRFKRQVATHFSHKLERFQLTSTVLFRCGRSQIISFFSVTHMQAAKLHVGVDNVSWIGHVAFRSLTKVHLCVHAMGLFC